MAIHRLCKYYANIDNKTQTWSVYAVKWLFIFLCSFWAADKPVSCINRAICVHLILSRYNLLTDAYYVIGLAYKFLLTLSITQVACERSFSTLKFVKNRLRSSLSQDNLEAFMLMCTEKEILMSISNDTVIDKVAETSALLRRLGCICCWCYSQCNCILYCELNCKH